MIIFKKINFGNWNFCLEFLDLNEVKEMRTYVKFFYF